VLALQDEGPNVSFDLGVWHSDKALSVDEARELYVKLCQQTWIPTEEHPAVQAFYEELCRAYPEVDTLPEDQLDDCPWSCAHDRSGLHVIITMSYGKKLSTVAKFVVDLAEQHGLLCYDPQGPNVYLPPQLKPKKSRFRFW
jgi:hypothetical protein